MGKVKKADMLLMLEKSKFKVACPYCTVKVSFYNFENIDKKVCINCGRYVFKNKQAEFKYRLEERLFQERRKVA